MLECGNCTACCDGWLVGSSYGNDFYPGKNCIYLCDKICTIYTIRPTACSNYQCGWSQELFEDWLKPIESNVIISVETGDVQYLKVVEMGIPIRQDVLEYIKSWCEKHNTYFILIKAKHED